MAKNRKKNTLGDEHVKAWEMRGGSSGGGALILWIRKWMRQIFTTLKILILCRGYFPHGFMDNYMPTGDVKSLHERECNEGRYKRSHQKEYLKWDLQESKDLLGKIDCSNWSVPQVVVFSVKLFLLLWCISFLNQFYELTRWASAFEMWLQGAQPSNTIH